MTGRRRQLRYQLAPVPRRPRTGPPPVPGTMIAGPDTIWREPCQPAIRNEYSTGKQAREQPQRLNYIEVIYTPTFTGSAEVAYVTAS